MLQEHCGWQNDIGEFRRLGHELFMNHHEEIIAAETFVDLVLVWADNGRIGVLNQKRLNRRAALQILFITLGTVTYLIEVEPFKRPLLLTPTGCPFFASFSFPLSPLVYYNSCSTTLPYS